MYLDPSRLICLVQH